MSKVGTNSTQPLDTTSGRLNLGDLRVLSEHLTELGQAIDKEIFAPNSQKAPPNFTLPQLAKLCGLSDDAMSRKLEKATTLGLASGYLNGEEPVKKNRQIRRSFTLKEAREWVNACGVAYKRKDPNDAVVIAVGFFKGGVGKTTLTVSLAQGLSLKGYRILVVDLDPQGSASALQGLSPAHVETKNTFAPICMPPSDEHHSDTLNVLPTYWDGIEILPANAELFGADFDLPVRQMNREQNFVFLEVLHKALQPIKSQYDFILIDTPPSLSYVTLNAYWAADGIVMPLPPDGLPFASSIQFWNMFSDLSQNQKADKEYSFLSVVPSMVDSQQSSTGVVMEWMKLAYKNHLSNVEIPATKAVKNSELTLQTVFDINKYVGSAKTYQRARDAYDKYVDEIEASAINKHWKYNEKISKQIGEQA
jgi:chromosome partitioning protein